MKPSLIFLTIFGLFLFYSSHAQKENDYTLFLKSGAFVPSKNISDSLLSRIKPTGVDESLKSGAKTKSRFFLIIQFDKIPTAAQKAIMSKSGIELMEYIPNNAYSAVVNTVLSERMLKQNSVRAVLELQPFQKMQPSLANGQYPDWSVKTSGSVDVRISFPKAVSFSEVSEGLTKNNFDIISTELKSYRILTLRVPSSRLNELAAFPFVEYVEAAPEGVQMLNYNSMAVSRANVLRTSPALGGRNLNGQGVAVGVGDNGSIGPHIDFYGRLINKAFFNYRGHSSHVTGTIGGAGFIENLYTGYAPGSTLISQMGESILTYSPTYVQDYGMVITNNSYGSVVKDSIYAGIYDLTSRMIDQQAFDLPELQHVFASGNDGAMTSPPYTTGFHTVLGGYQSSKNALIVGSVEYHGSVSAFSSRGPVRDGRLKPEIMSMGNFVISDWVNNGYSYSSGTSMAAPGVSGGLALLLQRYRQLNGNANPKNALMKILAVNGATDVGNPGPDFKHGFGDMNLMRSLSMLENNRYLNASVSNSGNNTHTIAVPANISQLKVMLYWLDPPASLLATKTLVNDLDLTVTTPSASIIFPKVLDSTASQLNNTAFNASDHVNNIEQVVINNPASGNYNISVAGTAITQNPMQEYYIAYDFVPNDSLALTFPIGAENLIPTVIVFPNPPVGVGFDTTFIYWDYYGNSPNNFSIEFSKDDGSTWSLLNGNIPSNKRIFSWVVPDTSIAKAKIRITKNGTGFTSTSQAFTINKQPTLSLAAVQCEGYITMNWTAVNSATDYDVMMFQNGQMVTVANTTSLTHTFTGLSKDSTYFVTIQPKVGGTALKRASAISRKPDSGTCAGALSDNDLKIDSLLTPLAGRKLTATELTATTPISIRIKNLDNVPVNSYRIRYSLNNGSTWTDENISTPIAGGASVILNFATTVNFSTVGQYPLLVAVENLSAIDTVTINNQAAYTIRQLDNQPLNLSTAFIDNIETANFNNHTFNWMGFEGIDRYDFSSTTLLGRVRPFINSGMAFSGSKALTIDASQFVASGNKSLLTGTFNLVNYNAGLQNVRLDFVYNNHTQFANDTNRVWIRGSDTDAWIPAYNLFANQNEPGIYKKTASIDLSGLLNSNTQNFSTSFQVRWGQRGVAEATDLKNGSGYSFDDIRIYTVMDDAQMQSIDTPKVSSCGLGANVPVRITVTNTTNNTLTTVPVKFRVDGAAFSAIENIPFIAANSTVTYTFTGSTANLSAIGSHTIEAVVDYPTDNFSDNDTIRLVLTNQPLVTTFPYLQNFETDSGNWQTFGPSIWQYGTPSSPKIRSAASGSKVWKTNLAGYYADANLSYLYSPCFNISSMAQPTLSFSVAIDIEDCALTGLCDAAWVEYTLNDGVSWQRLGQVGQGTNWYNRNYSGFHLWSQENYTRWHVATTALPTNNNSSIKFRFVFRSDSGVRKDGIAIDDIHIYDNIIGIYDGASMTMPVTQTINAGVNNWIDFTSGGKLIASVHPNNQAFGLTAAQAFINTGAVRTNSDQYYHNRNIIIQPDPALVNLADSAAVRFYFLDSETEALIAANSCGYCTKPTTAYELGVSKFSSTNDAIEDGSVNNNTGGNWLYILPANVVKVPFDKGYYAEFKVKNFSEFWLNNGWLTKDRSLPVQLISFNATKTADKKNSLLQWKTVTEEDVIRYEIEVAKGQTAWGQNQFEKLGELLGSGSSTDEHEYNFTDVDPVKFGVRYYRLKIIKTDGSFSFSDIRSVIFNSEISWQMFPNPSSGVFHFVYQAERGQMLNLKVVDVAGKVVYRKTVAADGLVQKTSVDLSNAAIASGLYLMQATIAGEEKSFSLLKQ